MFKLFTSRLHEGCHGGLFFCDGGTFIFQLWTFEVFLGQFCCLGKFGFGFVGSYSDLGNLFFFKMSGLAFPLQSHGTFGRCTPV